MAYFIDEKIYKNILIYDISHKTFMISKPLRIWFDKIDGFIKLYNGIRYLALLGHSWYDNICDSIKYLISKKMVLKIVLIIILQESELTHITLYLLKKYWLFIMLLYLLSQLLIRMKITITIIYFQKKVRIKIFLNECLYILNAIFL